MKYTLIVTAFAAALQISAASDVVAQDYTKAYGDFFAGDFQTVLDEMRPFAEQGDVTAQYLIDKVCRAEWEGIKCQPISLSPYGQYNYGQSLARGGDGVLQDEAAGRKWILLSAGRGHAQAQYKIGTSYYFGDGVSEDYTEAMRWFRLAAEQGSADAQYYLGSGYFAGQGLRSDRVLAHMWSNIADANGSSYPAGSRRDILADGMSSDQILEAVTAAKICMDTNYVSCGWQ